MARNTAGGVLATIPPIERTALTLGGGDPLKEHHGSSLPTEIQPSDRYACDRGTAFLPPAPGSEAEELVAIGVELWMVVPP